MIKKISEITQPSSVGGHVEDGIDGLGSGAVTYDDRVHDFAWWFSTGAEAQEFIEFVGSEDGSIQLHGPYSPRVPSVEEHRDKFFVALVTPSREDIADKIDELIEEFYGELEE